MKAQSGLHHMAAARAGAPAVYEYVTPQMAEKWINEKNGRNRTVRWPKVDQMAADMEQGRWTQCHVPIEFYTDGNICDGQHRLLAIVMSGKGQLFPIVRGVQIEDGLNKDTGTARSLVDNAHISGLNPALTNEAISWSRSIETGQIYARSKRPPTNYEKLEMVEKHKEVIAWLSKHGPHGKGLRNAPILAALGRAWYLEDDKDRLAKFSEVLATGFSEGPEDAAAQALRTYMLTSGKGLLSTTQWEDTFRKAQNAIWYFMRRRPLHIIKQIADEMYPLGGPRGQK